MHMPMFFKICGKQIYVTPNGIKLTSRGKVVPVEVFLSGLDKGERRKLRKALYKMGDYTKAAARAA